MKIKKILTCNACGWFISDPTKQDLEGECLNCGVKYKDSNSTVTEGEI